MQSLDGEVEGNSMLRTGPGDQWLASRTLTMLTPTSVIHRIESVRELIAANAPLAEQIRRPTEEVWHALTSTGLFYWFVPKRYGGLEFSVEHFVDAILPIAEGCCSTAWVAGFCAYSNWILAQFPARTQARIFKQFPFITAACVVFPPGQAVSVNGGYRVTGKWRWATGISQANWVLVGASEGEGNVRLFLSRIKDVTIVDTWDASGMRGTGSHDILLKDVFIPAESSIPLNNLMSGDSIGAKFHNNAMYRVPMQLLLAVAAGLGALGGARAALREIGKVLVSSPNNDAIVHLRFGRGHLALEAGEMTLREVSRRISRLEQSEIFEMKNQAALHAKVCYAVELCQQTIGDVRAIGGSFCHLASSPIQRILRDIDVIASHRLLRFDSGAVAYGRTLAGLSPRRSATP